MHLDDVRVAQATEGRSLPTEQFEFLLVGERAREQHLDRDRAIKRELPCPVDNTHATVTEYGLHLVARYLREGGDVA